MLEVLTHIEKNTDLKGHSYFGPYEAEKNLTSATLRANGRAAGILI